MSGVKSTFVGLKKGQKFRVIGNTNSHNYPRDTELTLNRDGEPSVTMDHCAIEVPHGNSLPFKDIEIISRSVKDFERRISMLDREKDNLLHKIEVCREFGTDTYDGRILEVFEALNSSAMMKDNKERARFITDALFGGEGV